MVLPRGLSTEIQLAVGGPASLIKRRNTILARLDSSPKLLGLAWHAAFGGDLADDTPLRFLAPVTPTRTSYDIPVGPVPATELDISSGARGPALG